MRPGCHGTGPEAPRKHPAGERGVAVALNLQKQIGAENLRWNAWGGAGTGRL